MRTGTRWVAAAVAGAALAVTTVPVVAGTSAGGSLAGETTPQGNVVAVRLNPSGTRIANLDWRWRADCTLGAAATATTSASTSWVDHHTGYAFRPDGRWGNPSVLTRTVDGVRQRFEFRVSGRRTAGGVSGSLRTTLIETDAAGGLIRRCASPVLRFTARNAQVLAGVTDVARQPVLVRTNVARTEIRRVRWAWEGTCTLGPAATDGTAGAVATDDVIGVPVRRAGGAFDRSVTRGPETDPATGNLVTRRAHITARFVGDVLRGSIEAGFTETVAGTGALVRDCSGTVRFRLRD